MATHEPDDTSQHHAGGIGPARHIVDRARDYVRLEAQGLTATQIARRRRKSKGYVSIALRLGRALRDLSAEELAVLRCDRVTWRVAQRVVREGMSDAAIVRQLRYAVGGFSTLNVDRRKHRRDRAGSRGGRGAAGAPAASGSDALTWHPDTAWAARDPAGYLDAYRAFLARLQRAVGDELRAGLALRAAARAAAASNNAGPAAVVPLAGQSLARLAQLVAGRGVSVNPDADQEARAARATLVALDRGMSALTIVDSVRD